MAKRFPDKDPAEIITVEFDFRPEVGSAVVTSPEVTAELLAGTDASPSAILLGGPTIEGPIVRQRLQGGTDGADYGLRCLATGGADRLLIDAVLPVRRRPIA